MRCFHGPCWTCKGIRFISWRFFLFACFVLFWPHLAVLRAYHCLCSQSLLLVDWDCMVFWGLNPGCLHVNQLPYPIYYLSGSSISKIVGSSIKHAPIRDETRLYHKCIFFNLGTFGWLEWPTSIERRVSSILSLEKYFNYKSFN